MNPSFEDTIPCATWPGFPQMPCANWFRPTVGSSDYFSVLYHYLACPSVPAPSNPFGYQNAKTGIAYAGFGIYKAPFILNPNIREYIEGTLIDTLKAGHHYCVSFYTVAGDKCKFLSDAIGAYLSVDSIYDMNVDTALSNYTPQISNPTGNIISDTLNWTLVSGIYIAQGGEKYITIGNFYGNANTHIDSLNNNPPLGYHIAYYYIDDVSVTDCTVGINNINPATTQSKLYPNPTKQTQVYYTNTLAANQTCNLQVTDMLGNIMATYTLNSGSNKITIDTSAYAKGVYVVKINVVGMAGESLKLVVE